MTFFNRHPKGSDWQASAPFSSLAARADLYRDIRRFFDERGVLEVQTPALAHYGVTEPQVDCIPVAGYGYLQSSPEYHMKRLLAQGSGPIWQLAQVFRDGEAGSRHNPEFTLLEWYRPGFSLEKLIAEVVALLWQVLATKGTTRVSFRDAFRAATGLDPMTASAAELDACARRKDRHLPSLERAALVDWLMATEVEAGFNKEDITIVTDFPAWQSALAEVAEDGQGTPVARRFEVYAGGVELANGYQELRDAGEQERRFERDRDWRRANGKSLPDSDPWLLAALAQGLPPVCGVALGVDRLLMVKLGVERIDQVMAFPWSRA